MTDYREWKLGIPKDERGLYPPLLDQIEAFYCGCIPADGYFLLNNDCLDAHACFDIEGPTASYPVLLSKKTFENIRDSRSIHPSIIANLHDVIGGSVLALDSLSDPEGKVLVTGASDYLSQPIAISTRVHGERVFVEDVYSIHGFAALQYLIDNTIKASLRVYQNDETAAWAQSRGITLPAPASTDRKEEVAAIGPQRSKQAILNNDYSKRANSKEQPADISKLESVMKDETLNPKDENQEAVTRDDRT